ncbi:hypothetical protein Micbo1qcDRAFT_194551 [Microdochium bolleyi]|uniref:Uncharacterized protein n=1 Tax=Microdochium bolleyi TaxID=196109 RepID=A0A136J838_9PEZI|nr:hypothetical protein Micbo1qcDRAFT_194551 [Microdochium bolleyi]
MALNGTLQADSLYISLDSRPLQDEYHWALVTTSTSTVTPTLRHASNLAGPWRYEAKPFDPRQRMMLIALVRVGAVADHDALERICGGGPEAGGVPAGDGEPSRRTGETFSCRTWLMDVLVALDEKGVVRLPMPVEALEQACRDFAAKFAERAETGGGPTVVDSFEDAADTK